ncbi:MAG TPA: hypothetical protein VIV57_22540 [Anaeromyxobacter sp.]
MNRASILPLALLALAACTPDFDPASRVEKLRVLAVQAEPPEIAPVPASGMPAAPDRAALTSLVLRADFATAPARETTVLYLACIPTPGDPTPSPCVLLAQLSDPASVLATAAGAACTAPPPGRSAPIAFAGVELCRAPVAGSWKTCGAAVTGGGATLPPPELAVPAGYGFDALPAGAPERILGVQAVVLAFVIDATPDELATGPGACPGEVLARRLAALWGERDHVLSTKRVLIRGPEAPDAPNENPAVDGIASGGTLLDPAAPASLPRASVTLTPVLPAGADALHQPYTELDSTGALVRSAREEWVYSWFGTTGELKDLHTRDGGVEPWDLAAAAGGPAVVAAVVRDLRGGVAWRWTEVTVAP